MAFDPISAAIIGGTQLLGGMMAGNAASSAASSQAAASQYAADKQLEAARLAADAAKFRPYSVTTGYGSSFFNPETQTAGYTLDPRLKAMQDLFYGQSEQALQTLGATSPEQEAQKYYAQQMGLLAPQRAQEDIAARQAGLMSGRIGLGVSPAAAGAGVGGGLLNPDEFARMKARELANAQLAAQSTEYGQSMIDKLMARAGTGLQQGAGVEELGLKPLTIGADIGNRQATAGAASGQLLSSGTNAAMQNLMQGTTAANQYRLAANLGTAQGLQNAGLRYGMMQQNPYTTSFNPGYNPYSGGFSLWAPSESAIAANASVGGYMP